VCVTLGFNDGQLQGLFLRFIKTTNSAFEPPLKILNEHLLKSPKHMLRGLGNRTAVI
jgi:hypothetical protein